MKLHIKTPMINSTLNFDPKKNSRLIGAKYGLLPLAMTFACMIGLNTFSIAQDNKNNITTTSNSNVATFEANNENPDVSPMAASFIEMGKPSGGYNVITDMTVFNGRLYLATSNNPLNSYGTNVFYTTTGTSFTNVLQSSVSQGYLRLGVYDNKLWIPDGDPNGLDPSYAHISSTGDASSFTQTTILQAVHSFDIIKYNNKMFVSNGMSSGQGGLCKYDGSTQWSSVYQNSNAFRMKYMVEFQGKLLVANSTNSGDIDYFIWNGDVETTSPTLKNSVTGLSFTFRWFASSKGKLFWTVASNGQIRCLVSSDGNTWSAVPILDGKFISDYVEFNNKLYALANDGLWESSDYVNFAKIASVPVAGAFSPVAVSGGNNVEAQASMEVYNGAIWCGSSTNGKLYKVDLGTTSISENTDRDLKIDNIYPNPFVASSIFHTTKPLNNATITIYNSLGEVVKSETNISGNSFTFDRGQLPGGIYFVLLSEDNITIASEKIIIAD